ncbi:MAG TPA: DUF2516 family protein [Nocardioidaceae bacterium]
MSSTAAVDAVLNLETLILFVIWILLFAVKTFALIDALFHKDNSYVAADKQNKAFWLLLLVIFLVLHYLISDPRHVLNLIGTTAALVYLADVRPTLRAMKRY